MGAMKPETIAADLLGISSWSLEGSQPVNFLVAGSQVKAVR